MTNLTKEEYDVFATNTQLQLVEFRNKFTDLEAKERQDTETEQVQYLHLIEELSKLKVLVNTLAEANRLIKKLAEEALAEAKKKPIEVPASTHSFWDLFK